MNSRSSAAYYLASFPRSTTMSEKKSTSTDRPTTMATGEEGGGGPTTMATGEEDVSAPTTMATGEEGPGPTTMATGEEQERYATTRDETPVQRKSPFGSY